MKPLLPGISEWSWFSEEKQLAFNGHFLHVGEHRILVDPPTMTSSEIAQVKHSGQVDYILLTNRDHEREAATYQQEFHCRIYVPENDASEMKVTPDEVYRDQDLLPGGIWSIQLADQKSKGESALFIQQGKGVLIVGDALLGKPAGSVCMLPAEKYTNVEKAREGLRRLLKYNFDALLVGDGKSILTGAKPIVEQVLQ
jgi:glyoxylase-like metal-dependent hydrolase (beta-lactamase superfamily II)